jgi:predicted ATP-grasp superfamily ATP-dependent carboligase
MRWPLIGNSAKVVTHAKDPAALAETCAKRGVPHPAWSARPHDGWLRKRTGGAGGAHVADTASEDNDRDYWQEAVDGEPVSALVLRCRRDVLVLGFSSQWADPSPAARFRYGGAARPPRLPDKTQSELAETARAVARELGLIGLNSIDFLVGDADWHMVEVNPRPGAVMDIFRPSEGSLFGLHVEACQGQLPERAPLFDAATAAAIVYAARPVARMPAMDWPDWTADRQRPGTSVAAGAPLCTVLATAGTTEEARQLVVGRAGEVRTMVEAAA